MLKLALSGISFVDHWCIKHSYTLMITCSNEQVCFLMLGHLGMLVNVTNLIKPEILFKVVVSSLVAKSNAQCSVCSVHSPSSFLGYKHYSTPFLVLIILFMLLILFLYVSVKRFFWRKPITCIWSNMNQPLSCLVNLCFRWFAIW